ncbi:MAG: ATP-binding cassette domain-containing protein, partial [Finegoldia magna]|nr:ATP-binding cassette domain-containing protein [Finegoldia magna]
MYKDLFKSMRLGAILGLISNIIQDVSAVFIATVLGTFTSAVLNSDIKSYKFDNIIEKEATMLRLNFIWAFQNISEALIIVLILIISLKELPIYYFIFIVAMGFLRFVSFTTFKNEVSEYTRDKYTFKENERKILFSCSFEKDWLKFNNLYTKFIQVYYELFDEFLKDKVARGEMYTKTQNAVRNLADGLFLILVVGFGIILCSKQIIGINSIIKVLAMSVVINKFFDCVKKSVDSFIQLKSLKVNVGKFYSIIPEDKVSNNGNSEIEINAKNLSYTVNDKNILKPVNFNIKKGDKVKISGENGTGKTTLIKILSNIYTDYNGNISINNTELN